MESPRARTHKKTRSQNHGFSYAKVVEYVRQYGDYTTLHGFRNLIMPNNHYSETVLWAIMIPAAMVGAAIIIWNNWVRYSENPTVIYLEKNFRDWNITFPAATVCFLSKLDESKASEYIQKEWGVKNGSFAFNYYSKFLMNTANLSFNNFDDFKAYIGDRDLEEQNLANIAMKTVINMEFHANIFDPTYNNIPFYETLTEMGICHTYNGVVPNYISLRSNPIISNLKLPKCNYLDSLCYARIEDLPTDLQFYIHSPFEIPDSSEKFHIVKLNTEKDNTIRYQETLASPFLRSLTPKQRQCRFYDEPDSTGPVYSYNLCRMKCRKRLAFQRCGCAPYFYIEEPRIPVCGVKGLHCLSAHAIDISSLTKPDGSKIDCKCLYQCETTAYYTEKISIRNWTWPVPCNIRFRWAIENYSKTRYKRDIIFGFEDLLVSLGGTAAFFLGCSMITFVEIVYFFTMRVFFYWMKR